MMFSRIGTLLGASGVAQAFERFMRKLQTDVEHTRVTNTEVAAIPKGTILGFTGIGDRLAEIASAAAQGNAQWAVVASEPIAAGAQGVAQTNGRTEVLFVAGLDPVPAAGELCYLSDVTPGSATNKATVTVGSTVVAVGRIVDASHYASGYCDVLLGQCATPQANI